MTESTPPISIALTTEKAVRSAYQQTSPKHRYRTQWKAGTWYERTCIVIGSAVLTGCAIAVIASAPWTKVYPIGFLGMVLLAYGVVATERRAFGHHIKVYGEMLNGRIGDPSRLRYLHFIDLIRSSGRVQADQITS